MTSPPSPTLLSETDRPHILILLATFNGARHIGDQLRSLAAQTDVKVSVLMADDASTDSTVDQAVSAAATCGLRLSQLHFGSPSGSAAQNFFRLFRQASFDGFDAVALCDQDDVWLDHKLSRAWAELQRTGADAYSCNSIAFWPDGRERAIRKDYPQRHLDYLFESASHGCTYVLTRSTAERFRAMLLASDQATRAIDFHDWLLYAWARHNGLRWHMDSDYCIRYRQSAHNVIGANAGTAAVFERIGRMRKRWLSGQSIQTADCIGLADHPVVKRLRRFGLVDRLVLASEAPECRRRPRDQWVFFLSCLSIGI